jgi:4'-phosphopantetheinyl transferase
VHAGITAPPISLPTDEAHVWYAWTAQCRDPALLAYYDSLLTPDERVRHARFAFDYLRDEYLLTRALCRLTLSRYAAVAPMAWQFERNDYGRPEIAGAQQALDLQFNLSNARSLVAIIVTRGRAAGIDVEETQRATEMLPIAGHYFSATELADLQALPAAQQPDRFFQLWTLKEAYIKARGMGLSIPLDSFAFRFDAATIGFRCDSGDDAAWQFAEFRPAAAHRLALAVRRGAGADCRIRLWQCVPGRAQYDRQVAWPGEDSASRA